MTEFVQILIGLTIWVVPHYLIYKNSKVEKRVKDEEEIYNDKINHFGEDDKYFWRR